MNAISPHIQYYLLHWHFVKYSSCLSPNPTMLKMMKKKPWLLLFIILTLSSQNVSSASYVAIGGGVGVWINGRATTEPPPPPPSSSADVSAYNALQAWKTAITEDPSGTLTTWVGPEVCTYKGIFCSYPPDQSQSQSISSSQAVLAIDLNRANLKGTLVKELAFLTHLSILHLNTNRFTGSIPDSFQSLRYLSELDLSNNLFSGAFPPAALDVPNLIYLDLRFNSFSGEIPDAIFRKNLDALFLNNNQFEGEIPASLWASSASVIALANNRLSGSIPASLGFVGSNMREILFLNNRLSGCIPDVVGYLNELEVLDLSFNSLTGQLPGSISCLTGIEVLNIEHNQLSGELSDLICDLKRLANLTVAYNFFSGFSQDCSKLFFSRNVGFDFSGNCIPGWDMQRPPPQCNEAPGSDLSCIGVPLGGGVACAAEAGFNFLHGNIP